MFWTKLGRGAAAGAAGVTVLNAITYLDMAVRARPSSQTPSQAVERLTQKAGAEIPGQAVTTTTAWRAWGRWLAS